MFDDCDNRAMTCDLCGCEGSTDGMTADYENIAFLSRYYTRGMLCVSCIGRLEAESNPVSACTRCGQAGSTDKGVADGAKVLTFRLGVCEGEDEWLCQDCVSKERRHVDDSDEKEKVSTKKPATKKVKAKRKTRKDLEGTCVFDLMDIFRM